MTVRGYTLAVDWSGHGTFVDAQEDVSSRVLRGDLVVTIGRDSNSTVDHSSSGELAVELNNWDRVLSPENTSSILFGSVAPGRLVKLTASAGAASYTLFLGPIDGLDIDTNSAPRTFSLTALDAWGKPGGESLSTPLYRGIRTGDAINVILDAIGWTGPRDIDAGVTAMPFWWVEGGDAASAVDDLISAEGPPAAAYVQGGTFVFRDRHARITNTVSQTSQGLFTHIIPAGSGPGSDYKIERDTFVYDHGLANIVNSVTFSVDVRALQNPTEVWSTDDAITLASGESTQVVASGSDPFINAAVTMTLLSGAATASLSRDNGASTTITITASSNTVVSRLAVVASSAAVSRTVKVTAEDAGSVGRYGRVSWPSDTPPFINPYDARAIADRIIAVNASNRPRVTFRVPALWSNASYMAKFLTLDIGDRITVRNDVLGLNTDFMVERLVHTISNLQVHHLEIGAQIADPTQPSNLFQFDLAGHGFNQGLFGTVGIDNAATMFTFDTAGQGFDQGFFST